MGNNTKKTSDEVAKLASQVLRNPNSSKIAKELAGSALSQKNTNNQTGSEIEAKASKVLQSEKYSEETKTLAGSILSQSKLER
jgi:hypothetical protein